MYNSKRRIFKSCSIPPTGKTDGKSEFNQGYRVVMQLTEPYFDTGRCVVFDNFFSSIPLAKGLSDKGTVCLGTLRANKREIPPEFLEWKKREIGSTLYGFHENLMLLSWVAKKKKPVLILSSDPRAYPSYSGNGKPSVHRMERRSCTKLARNMKVSIT